jgi:hypothetical protein
MPSIRSSAIALLLWCACGESPGEHETPDERSDSGMPAQTTDDAAAGSCEGALDCACLPGGDCNAGLVCDVRRAVCRAPTVCDGRCVAHQRCTVGEDKDAVCEAACEEGYRWDAVTNSCLAEPSCDPETPGSIVQSCAYENRTCDDSAETVRCGACLGGAVLRGGRCVAESCEALSCKSPQVCVQEGADGARCGGCEAGYAWSDKKKQCFVSCYDGLKCKSDEVCVEGDGEADASCELHSGCNVGEVENRTGACLDCTKCYDHSTATPTPRKGVKGIANGGRVMQNECVCQLEDGYFQNVSGDVLSCDSDQDGFVTRRFTEIGTEKSPFAKEARCKIPRIDRFVLRSDDVSDTASGGTTRERVVTVDELVRMHDLPDSAFEYDENVKVVELVENEALDEPELFETRYKESSTDSLRLRPYGNGKGKFGPAQANPLTKVCNHDFDDFNMDEVADVEQAQGTTYPEPMRAVFYQMAYFVELAHGQVEKNADNSFFRYVISERSRTPTNPHALPFALTSTEPSARERYTQTCMRSRDVNYPGIASNVPNWARVGFDFARFQCDAAAGGCSVTSSDPRCADPTTAPKWCKHVGYDGRYPEYHQALEIGGGAAWDVMADSPYATGDDAREQLWPGMNHHSQFKCQSSSAAEEVHVLSPNRVLDSEGQWKRFDCSLKEASPPEGEPSWDCTPRTLPRSESGTLNYWAAVDYAPGSSFYERGCIDEHLEWGFACGAWSGRTSTRNEPFDVQALSSGRFTCAGDCTRGGAFLSTEDGGVCCYGDLDGDECQEHNYQDQGARSLLCAIDAAAVSAGVLTCAEALGEFVWAHDEGDALDDPFDPNVMLWAGEDGPESLRGSIWGCGVEQSCP